MSQASGFLRFSSECSFYMTSINAHHQGYVFELVEIFLCLKSKCIYILIFEQSSGLDLICLTTDLNLFFLLSSIKSFSGLERTRWNIFFAIWQWTCLYTGCYLQSFLLSPEYIKVFCLKHILFYIISNSCEWIVWYLCCFFFFYLIWAFSILHWACNIKHQKYSEELIVYLKNVHCSWDIDHF